MTQTNVWNAYDLPTVPNVCDQILRELIRLPSASMAHVIMQPGNVSLLHEHKKMREFYFILEGKGIFYYGDKALGVEKGSSLTIPHSVSHKLKNTTNGKLEHLVFAMPPFDPEDVFLIPDHNSIPSVEKFKFNKKPFTARDGAKVYEIDSAEERKESGVAFAYGTLSPKRKATLHVHHISDEVYYIISGEGKVTLGDDEYSVRKGSVIHVPTHLPHGLENTTNGELEVLCLSTPPYQDADFIIIE